jgi:hypothetical protein
VSRSNGGSSAGRLVTGLSIALLFVACGGGGGGEAGIPGAAADDELRAWEQPGVELDAATGCGWLVDGQGERTGVVWPDGVEVVEHEGRSVLVPTDDVAYVDEDAPLAVDGGTLAGVLGTPTDVEELDEACRDSERAWRLERVRAAVG